jgi:hypothetical protein
MFFKGLDTEEKILPKFFGENGGYQLPDFLEIS